MDCPRTLGQVITCALVEVLERASYHSAYTAWERAHFIQLVGYATSNTVEIYPYTALFTLYPDFDRAEYAPENLYGLCIPGDRRIFINADTIWKIGQKGVTQILVHELQHFHNSLHTPNITLDDDVWDELDAVDIEHRYAYGKRHYPTRKQYRMQFEDLVTRFSSDYCPGCRVKTDPYIFTHTTKP